LFSYADKDKLEKEVNELIYRADYSSTTQEKVLGRLLTRG